MNAPLPPVQFAEIGDAVPRFRTVGDLTLDLAHRDGRVDAEWLGLCQREFALLWRLAQQPGERISAGQLLAEAWHIAFEPDTDGIAVHIARVRGKLAAAGVGHLICTDGDERYFLAARS